jgi:hypothetical protein
MELIDSAVVETAAPVGNSIWLADACMNRVSRARAARARMCVCVFVLAELHRHASSFTAGTRCCFETGMYLHCYPKTATSDMKSDIFRRRIFFSFFHFQVTLTWLFPSETWLHAKSRFLPRSARVESPLRHKSPIHSSRCNVVTCLGIHKCADEKAGLSYSRFFNP